MKNARLICVFPSTFLLVVKKIPGGPKAQVFAGTALILGVCAIPVFAKDQARGHDLFSQEKPEAVVQSEKKILKESITKTD